MSRSRMHSSGMCDIVAHASSNFTLREKELFDRRHSRARWVKYSPSCESLQQVQPCPWCCALPALVSVRRGRQSCRGGGIRRCSLRQSECFWIWSLLVLTSCRRLTSKTSRSRSSGPLSLEASSWRVLSFS